MPERTASARLRYVQRILDTRITTWSLNSATIPPFELNLDIENKTGAIDDLSPHTTPIDYVVEVEPKYRNYLRLQSRIDLLALRRGTDIENWFAVSKARLLLEGGLLNYNSGTADTNWDWITGMPPKTQSLNTCDPPPMHMASGVILAPKRMTLNQTELQPLRTSNILIKHLFEMLKILLVYEVKCKYYCFTQ